jgi:hypothetical protein
MKRNSSSSTSTAACWAFRPGTYCAPLPTRPPSGTVSKSGALMRINDLDLIKDAAKRPRSSGGSILLWITHRKGSRRPERVLWLAEFAGATLVFDLKCSPGVMCR